MKNIIFFFLVVLVSFMSYSQNHRETVLEGIISSSLPVENIHIINKNSGKATISTKYGKFKIPVKVNDTLVFSGIQFFKKELIITKQLIKHKFIIIKLFEKRNELDEVEIKAHNLSGNLLTDADKVKDSIFKVNSLASDFSTIDFSKALENEVDIKHFKNQGPTRLDASKLTDPIKPLTVDVLAVLGLVLEPLTKEVSKMIEIERRRKKEKKSYQEKVLKASEKIRTELSDSFFIETLKIPKKEITVFINYCKPKGIIDLYIKGRKMEVLDILIKESILYRKIGKQD